MALGRMGKGEIKVRCLNLEPQFGATTYRSNNYYSRKTQTRLLCTLAKDPIINAEYN